MTIFKLILKKLSKSEKVGLPRFQTKTKAQVMTLVMMKIIELNICQICMIFRKMSETNQKKIQCR